MVGRWVSFWEGLFSGAMLNFGEVMVFCWWFGFRLDPLIESGIGILRGLCWNPKPPIQTTNLPSFGCFLKWWYPQNTPKWSCLVGKPMVVGYHHFRKHSYNGWLLKVSWRVLLWATSVVRFDNWAIKKKPGCLGYIGKYTAHLCGDYN